MTLHNSIQLFEAKKVRTIWDDKEEKWYFSIVDVVAVLTDSLNPRKYWSALKKRLKKEGSELATNCCQLKTGKAVVTPLNARTGIALNPPSVKEENEEQL